MVPEPGAGWGLRLLASDLSPGDPIAAYTGLVCAPKRTELQRRFGDHSYVLAYAPKIIPARSTWRDGYSYWPQEQRKIVKTLDGLAVDARHQGGYARFINDPGERPPNAELVYVFHKGQWYGLLVANKTIRGHPTHDEFDYLHWNYGDRARRSKFSTLPPSAKSPDAFRALE